MRTALFFVILCLTALLYGCGGGRSLHGPVPAACLDVAQTARMCIGAPYRYGGTSPESGFDCSGFTMWVYSRNRIRLPRQTSDQMNAGKKVAPDELRTGDLVFFETVRRGPSHVGIYTDGGRFVHCPSTGGCVREDGLTEPYWRSSYLGARRIIP
ncbi:MAG: C40 family peptidase [Acidobacteriota bacterium]